MAPTENTINAAYSPDQPTPPDQPTSAGLPDKRHSTLEWWPAAVLLLAMLIVRNLPSILDSSSLPIFMTGFFGPAAIGVLILIWWMAASRASGKEKLVGLIGFIVIAVVAIALTHFTMKGMSTIGLVIPSGIAAFAIGLILLAKSPRWRVPFALLATVLTFGFWDTIRSEGVTGRFANELAWRWEPTDEEIYLRELANRNSTAEEQQTDDAQQSDITLASAQWPSFRGPVRDGALSGVVLNEDWTTSPPRKVWNTKIGPGWSSFTVAGDRLFTQEQRGENEAVICLDANTGNLVWDYVYPSRFWEAIAGAGPRATPTIADEGLFALGANGILVCLHAGSGKEAWKRDLRVDADRQAPMWGFAASPLVTGGLVVVHAGGKGDKGVLAYDAKSGEPKWSVASGDHSYSSAQAASFDSVAGLLMTTNAGLQFLNVSDGQTIWEYRYPVENYRALQPLVIDNSVLIGTSLGVGTRRLSVSRDEGGVWKVEEEWTSLDMKPDFNDFVFYDGYIYGFDGEIFACIDAKTGERKWKRGRYGNGQVLLLADAGQLLVASEKGEMVLLHATPEKLDEVARFNAIEGKTWNHPVVVGNRLYVRNAGEAACFELTLKQ